MAEGGDKKIGGVYIEVGLKDTVFRQKWDSLHKLIKENPKVMTAIQAAGIAAFSGLVTAITATTTAAAMFEYQMAMVATLLERKELILMRELSDRVKQLSVDFAQSTKVMSRALYDVLSAMVPVGTSLYVLTQASKLAVSGFTSVQIAGDAITTMLNSYAMAATRAGDISDWLWAVVRRGKVTMDELAPVVGIIAPSAGMAGIRLEELGAAISTITRTGMRAPRAMTALVGLLRAFMRPLRSTEEAGRNLGMQMNQQTLQVLGLTGVLELLKNATAEQLGQIVPTIRGYRAVAALIKNYEGYLSDLTYMQERAGLTTEKLAIVQDTAQFRVMQLTKSIGALSREIGESYLPAVKAALEGTEMFAKGVTVLPERTKSIIGWITSITLVLVGFAAGWKILGWTLAKLGISALLTKIAIAWKGVAAAATIAKIATVALSATLAVLVIGLAAIGWYANKQMVIMRKLEEVTEETGKHMEKAANAMRELGELQAGPKATTRVEQLLRLLKEVELRAEAIEEKKLAFKGMRGYEETTDVSKARIDAILAGYASEGVYLNTRVQALKTALKYEQDRLMAVDAETRFEKVTLELDKKKLLFAERLHAVRYNLARIGMSEHEKELSMVRESTDKELLGIYKEREAWSTYYDEKLTDLAKSSASLRHESQLYKKLGEQRARLETDRYEMGLRYRALIQSIGRIEQDQLAETARLSAEEDDKRLKRSIKDATTEANKIRKWYIDSAWRLYELDHTEEEIERAKLDRWVRVEALRWGYTEERIKKSLQYERKLKAVTDRFARERYVTPGGVFFGMRGKLLMQSKGVQETKGKWGPEQQARNIEESKNLLSEIAKEVSRAIDTVIANIGNAVWGH